MAELDTGVLPEADPVLGELVELTSDQTTIATLAGTFVKLTTMLPVVPIGTDAIHNSTSLQLVEPPLDSLVTRSRRDAPDR
jgi:hypothetical protein